MEKRDGAYRKPSMVWRYRWKEEVLVFTLLTALAFFINAAVQIRGLFMDDLYMWYWFAEGSFPEYVFPIGSDRFRALYNFISYLEYFFVGSRAEWFVPVNIVVNSMIAYMIHRFARRLSENGLMGFLCAALYLLSRMSYYQIGQVMGMMESLALWAAIAVLYCLYQYLNRKEYGESCYWAACGFYFANCFIHERYMVLLPLFFLVLLLRRDKRPARWIVPLALFALVQGIRFLTIGTVLPAGTDGTYVADTFGVRQTIKFMIQQVLILFGVNTGDAWLNPCLWDRMDLWVKLVVIAEDLVILTVALLFILKIIRDRKNRAAYLSNSALFILFIGLCILSSSVTVRVEIRWVYVSMTAALLFLSYMCGAVAHREMLGEEGFERNVRRRYRGLAVSLCLMAAYAVLSCFSEGYNRSCYSELYLWNPQKEYNSLADETWGRYGEEIFGKKIYLLRNTDSWSQLTSDLANGTFDPDTFFRVFDPEKKAEGTEVFVVDSIRDFGLVNNNMLILREVPDAYAYQDITSFVKKLKCEPLYGYYDDGWMDEHAAVRVMAGSTGKIELELLHPGVTTGEEVMTISIDGGETTEVKVEQSIQYVTLQTVPYRTVELKFDNNFYQEGGSLGQRGEDRFSIIVNISAD